MDDILPRFIGGNSGGDGAGAGVTRSKEQWSAMERRCRTVSRLSCCSRGWSVRVTEARLLVAITLLFALMCLVTQALLPDWRAGLQSGLQTGLQAGLHVHAEVARLGDSLLVPPVAPRPDTVPLGGQGGQSRVAVDRARLFDRVRSEGVLPPPLIESHQRMSSRSPAAGNSWSHSGSGVSHTDVMVTGGEDRDPVMRARRDKIKQMMVHAWSGYERYAWGANELRPVSRRPHTASVFGGQLLGATIVDSLDTLYMMGLRAEFERARLWVRDHLRLDTMNGDLSVFETNIRYVGGLLSSYALTGDVLFRDKAHDIASLLLPAFNTPHSLPYSLINPVTKRTKNYHWASAGSSILSEMGTLHMEMAYLTDVTGNTEFEHIVRRIRRHLRRLSRTDGLYYNYIRPDTGEWAGSKQVSVGGLGDSFYEYLLKEYLRSGGADVEARAMYDSAIGNITQRLLFTSPHRQLVYLAELNNNVHTHKMDHLACFIGGLYALGAVKNANANSTHYMHVAEQITRTCHHTYNSTATGLGPESFRFSSGAEGTAKKQSESVYLLRPEVVESYFVLWRLTGDVKYREWGWQAAQAIERHCLAAAGYSGIRNVNSARPQQDDVQQSFFLAETLKYLYLLFSDSRLFSLDQWVFNTEAHPLPIRGANVMYRSAQPAAQPAAAQPAAAQPAAQPAAQSASLV